jgi:glyoxylase-like metal-dependent hydrolase (beta-lactamase superfamily II)
VGLAGWFQAQGADLLIPRTGWLYARMLTLDVQERPSVQAIDFLRRAGMPADLLARRQGERPFNFADSVAPMPTGFTRIAEGNVLTLAGRRWQVRMGNGHAPEHATLWSLDDHLILGGDQLLPGISANIGVYATEPGADPLGEWLASCRAFQPLARPDHLVLPGHKTPYTGLSARLTAMIDEHLVALDRLLAHLAVTPSTACDLFPVLYGREIRPGEYSLALAEAVAHVNHLAARGAIRAGTRADGALLWRRT